MHLSLAALCGQSACIKRLQQLPGSGWSVSMSAVGPRLGIATSETLQRAEPLQMGCLCSELSSLPSSPRQAANMTWLAAEHACNACKLKGAQHSGEKCHQERGSIRSVELEYFPFITAPSAMHLCHDTQDASTATRQSISLRKESYLHQLHPRHLPPPLPQLHLAQTRLSGTR